MPWGSIISGSASLLGGLLGSDASEDAAAAQQAAAAKAEEGINRRFDLTRADQAPFMRSGTMANQRLAHLLGLGGTPGGKSTQSRDQLRQSLIGKFSTGGGMQPTYGDRDNYETGEGWANGIHIPRAFENVAPTVDEAGLQAAIDAEMGGGSDSSAADYGSLLRGFTAGDMEADPVYQSGLKFGLDQGTGAINQRAIAGGGYDSGATLKALTKFANDYGSTKANDSYNRFNMGQDRKYNKLAGISGTGQQAVNQVGSQGMAAQNAITGLTTDAGNSRAAGIMGGANAWGDAISGVGKAADNYFGSKRLKGMLSSGYAAPTYDYGMGGPQ